MAGPNQGSKAMQIAAIMLAFFVMGFVDFIGVATNYVKADFNLSDSQASVFPLIVFLAFFFFSVPTGMLMNKIGRKNTVLVSLIVTLIALVIPLPKPSFVTMLLAFSALGIGNAIMQTSLNPLVGNVVDPKILASTLTLGQFVKSCCSALGPILLTAAVAAVYPTFGLGWRGVFPVFLLICCLSIFLLKITPVHEAPADKVTGVLECLKLLGSGFVFLSFCGIMCHVGIDVGINVTATRIFVAKCGITQEQANFALSVYFIARLIGSLTGAGLLAKMSARVFFVGSVILILCGLGGLIIFENQAVLYVCMFVAGLGNCNIFPIIFAQAMKRRPDEQNEVAGLMVMGIVGGAIFPVIMGFLSDGFTGSLEGLETARANAQIIAGQNAAVGFMILAAVYLLIYSVNLRSK